MSSTQGWGGEVQSDSGCAGPRGNPLFKIGAFSLLVPSFLFAGYTYGASTPFGAAMAVFTSLGGGLLSLVWYILVGTWLLRRGSNAGRGAGRSAGRSDQFSN